jgi:aromatic ring-cleaving dioxygenase
MLPRWVSDSAEKRTFVRQSLAEPRRVALMRVWVTRAPPWKNELFEVVINSVENCILLEMRDGRLSLIPERC